MEKRNKIRYVWHGVLCCFFYSFEDAYEFNYGKNKEELQEKMVTTIIPNRTIGVRLGIIVIYD
jgi:hypothetical protein